ncbi:Detected protein of unknown function [Hibiscus syriacus]|uniref:DUF7788 domain-containing protein n=1 Tax=Hibiscus syriacus TaxID=106335 RepID=A0A6A3AY17_HIBSY|nr:Detected protein of unknown function [Hibiscus syriacus]
MRTHPSNTEVLVPLHEALQLPEVKTGNAKISAGALLPHEIIGSLKDKDGEQCGRDTNGGFGGTWIVELSEEPWKGKVNTFSENPELHLIEGDTLKAKTEFVRNMEWGGNTDFQKVFDQILAVVVEGKLSEEQLIKRVFVFSDMEFDDANGNHSKYLDNMDNQGNGEDEMTWEERQKEWGRTSITYGRLIMKSYNRMVANQDGVALVSGFSKNLPTLFLEEGGIVNPQHVMELAIGGEEYKELAVHY